MSNYDWLTPRVRGKHLLIVEGNHEKDKLLSLLLNIYPEINIKLEDIIVYGTNIYMLYKDIVLEYRDILTKQNNDSRDPVNGIIWVLNTSVFLIPDYNFNLLKPKNEY